MKINNKKAIFFDLDHTLWDFEKNSALAFEELLPKFGIAVDADAFNALFSPLNVKYWKLFRDGEITQAQLRYGRLKEAFTALNYDISNELIEEVSVEYVRLLPTNNHLYEGTIEILDYLKSKYSLHIITNGFSEVQARKMQSANIHHYFDTVTNSELAGCKKPDPAIFEYALTAANAQKADSIMIGDCIEADVQGALDCGLDAIYFNEHNLEAHPTIKQVNHLLQLKQLL
ncbi:noncanonical pyrimidine nucleotidase, YjjG family [Flavobacterium zepuense]|uniref:Noncanonical pyrimidine nucleotidase, YjjG family n=1 Tax=Flavobacterium zepuense TaxID=2593302 RepID=A0A552V7D1_9FLAO|nr:YjjG family noncanonical pyrimidine nucleotidase [Flavobacterium zepuense]TRW26369.1 noncanonical pyrimidine nucleotidase, YjjG family [Flavobacterium zepuense]